MTKEEAVRKYVTELDGIPTTWFQSVLKDGEVVEIDMNHHHLPMWGTMFILPDFDGETVYENSSIVEDEDDEMYGERQVLDENGEPFNLYVYEADGRYVVGINGAGWGFYDGVWDRLYDLLGLKWHNEG